MTWSVSTEGNAKCVCVCKNGERFMLGARIARLSFTYMRDDAGTPNPLFASLTKVKLSALPLQVCISRATPSSSIVKPSAF